MDEEQRETICNHGHPWCTQRGTHYHHYSWVEDSIGQVTHKVDDHQIYPRPTPTAEREER